MTQLPETITKARARLLVRAPFFGSIALGLAWVNAPEVRTMATDGCRIWFNAGWCDKHGVEKTMGVIAHEVLHVVNKHHLRRGIRDPKLWNVAADLMINRLLEDDSYVLPPDGLFDRDRRFVGLPTETIYARLLEEQGRNRRHQPADGPASQGVCDPSSARAGRTADLRVPVDRDHRFRLIVIIESVRS
jgi:predicted metal-dependent peptidase